MSSVDAFREKGCPVAHRVESGITGPLGAWLPMVGELWQGRDRDMMEGDGKQLAATRLCPSLWSRSCRAATRLWWKCRMSWPSC